MLQVVGGGGPGFVGCLGQGLGWWLLLCWGFSDKLCTGEENRPLYWYDKRQCISNVFTSLIAAAADALNHAESFCSRQSRSNVAGKIKLENYLVNFHITKYISLTCQISLWFSRDLMEDTDAFFICFVSLGVFCIPKRLSCSCDAETA